MAALRTLWRALVSVYEETLQLIVGNVAALALNLPLGLVFFLLALPLAPNLVQSDPTAEDNTATQWLAALIAWLIVFLPTPGNVALAGLTQVAAGPDVPRFNQFRQALRTHWNLALRCTVISVVVLAALIWNIVFYLSADLGPLRLISILWMYGALFWLSLHIYLAPLMVHVEQPRLLNLYKRASLVTIGHFGYTVLLLIPLLVLSFVSVLFLPVYVLATGAYISVVQAHALREIRRRHGDLAPEEQEGEVGTL
jgi:uncharacterized membrane protein YesL